MKAFDGDSGPRETFLEALKRIQSLPCDEALDAIIKLRSERDLDPTFISGYVSGMARDSVASLRVSGQLAEFLDTDLLLERLCRFLVEYGEELRRDHDTLLWELRRESES